MSMYAIKDQKQMKFLRKSTKIKLTEIQPKKRTPPPMS